MTTRAWILVCVAYVILTVAWFGSLWVVDRHTDRLDRHTKALEAQTKEIAKATALFCEISARDDAGERQLLARVAAGKAIRIDPVCRKFVARVLQPTRDSLG